MSKKNSAKFERTSAVIKCTMVTIVPGRGYDTNEKWRVIGERYPNTPSHEYQLESSRGEKMIIYAMHTRFDAWATHAERKNQASRNSLIGLGK